MSPAEVSDFPIGTRIETDVHSIGDRMNVVQGTVIGHWSNLAGRAVLLTVDTEMYGQLSVEPSKARAVQSSKSDDN